MTGLQIQNYVDGLADKPDQLGCNCLPDCVSITYDMEISQAKTNYKQFLAAMSQADENSSRTYMSIFFKNTQFIALHRSEMFGTASFLANCGGLLGLFLGMSVLSVVEMVYFLSLRLFCNIRMRGNHTHSYGSGVGIVG